MSIIDSQEPAYREEHEIDVLTRRIAELERSLEHYRLEVFCYENNVDERDELIRDMWAGIVREHPQGGFPDMGLIEKRMRKLGIEVSL